MGFANAIKSGVLKKVMDAVKSEAPVQESGSMNGLRYSLSAKPIKKDKDKDKEKTTNMKCGGKVHKMKKGGKVGKCKRDGIAVRGKTRAGR